MPIKYCAILPHSPILIPEIGQSNRVILQKTLDSYEKVGQELREKEIDNIIVFTPHGPVQEAVFLCQSGLEMGLGTREISYIGSRKKVSSDLSLSQAICEAAREQFTIYQTTPEMLDYGSSIPLALLLDETFNPRVTVINKADGLSLADQYRFGQQVAQTLENSPRHCAVIASADLSHRLKRNSPGGYSPKGAKFDNKLIEYLSDNQNGPAQILAMDQNLVRDAKSCGIKSIASALGAIAHRCYEPQVLSYQTELGVGYLSFVFKLI